MPELTRLEQAILDVLAADTECSWHIGCDDDCHQARTKAIAAAVQKVKTTRTRKRSSAKAAGSRMETITAAYLAQHVDDRIERRVTNGALDRGDIAGLRAHGKRLVVEVKDHRAWEPGSWLKEAERERHNDNALAGVVVAKRHGVSDPGQQIVLMTLADYVALITGARPEETQ